MIKKNSLRKVYTVYWIILGEVFCVAFILSSTYVVQETLRTIIQVVGYAGIVLIPLVMFIFYRWIKKDNAAASDELEQMLLRKAFAITGLLSISLSPFLILLSSIFPEAAGFIAIAYTFIIGGTFKIATFILYRNY